MRTIITLLVLSITLLYGQEIPAPKTLKSYGRADTQEIVSLPVDANGVIDTSPLKPLNAPSDWQAPTILPLVKIDKPNDNKFYDPHLVWFSDRVERQWVERVQTAAEIAAAADKAERQAVKALMADIKAGTGTNGERITRLEKAVRRLLKDWLRE